MRIQIQLTEEQAQALRQLSVDTGRSLANDLQHTPRGIHNQRTAIYQGGVAAVGELLDLIGAWVTASVRSTPTG